MRKSRYSDEQIAAALRQAEIGTPVADITRKLGISEATFYVWKKRFGTLGTPVATSLSSITLRIREYVSAVVLRRRLGGSCQSGPARRVNTAHSGIKRTYGARWQSRLANDHGAPI